MKRIDTQLAKFVRWENAKTFWLHLIWTPDTIHIVEEVRDLIQGLLDLHSINKNWHPSTKYNVTTWSVEYWKFASWEAEVTIDQSVRWKHVYLFSDPNWDARSKNTDLKRKLNELFSNDDINNVNLKSELEKLLLNTDSANMSFNDKLIHDLLTLEAIKDHWAQTTNLVMSCMAYARQDKTTPNKRQPISINILGKIIADLTWNTWYCITTNLHNSASKSAFSGTQFINLYTWWLIEEAINDLWKSSDNLVLSPADVWWMKTIEEISKELKLKHITVVKSRDYSSDNEVSEMSVYWDIEWKDVLIHDDMLDTWWTMVTLLEKMLEKNPKSINLVITHWMFNKNAYSKLQEVIDKSNGIIKNIYISDSINKEWLPDYVKVIKSNKIITNVITNIFKWYSIDRWDNTDYTDI